MVVWSASNCVRVDILRLMEIRVTAESRRIDEYRLPESVEPFFVLAKSANSEATSPFSAVLDRVVAPDSTDDSYDKVADLGEIQLLAESKVILAAIKNGLQRRSQTPVAEGEIIDLR